MRSLRLPSEDPRIEGPPYMKGEKRPPEMVCQRFMPLEHEAEEQTCSCKKKKKKMAKDAKIHMSQEWKLS